MHNPAVNYPTTQSPNHSLATITNDPQVSLPTKKGELYVGSKAYFNFVQRRMSMSGKSPEPLASAATSEQNLSLLRASSTPPTPASNDLLSELAQCEKVHQQAWIEINSPPELAKQSITIADSDWEMISSTSSGSFLSAMEEFEQSHLAGRKV